MKFLWLDHWYPEAYLSWKRIGGPWLHGTADFWDVALISAGHESHTHLINEDPDFQLAIANHRPGVICSQNIGMWGAYEGSPLAEFRRLYGCKLVGFCSYRADEQTYLGWDVLFTSFPWLVDHVRSLGVRCEYLPLAFGRPVLDRIGELPKERDIPVAFIGGLGSRIWDQGTKTMAAIAEAVPSFRWWGYKLSELPPSLKRSYQGQAWGLDYYRILARTKICVNRHGEIARGFGNNMRTFESGGLGCCLLTDHAGELEGTAMVYNSPEDAIRQIADCLDADASQDEGRFMQEEVLSKHTFDHRIIPFLKVIESL